MKTQLSLIAACLFVLMLPTLVLAIQEPEVEAQASEQVYIPFQWKQGDIRKYRITNRNSSQKDGTTKLDRQTARDIEIEVVEKSDQGMVVTWLLSDDKALESVVSSDPLVSEAKKVYSGLKIRVQIDGDGVYQGIQNVAEIDAANDQLRVLD